MIPQTRSRIIGKPLVLTLGGLLAFALIVTQAESASAAGSVQPTVGLGTADSFEVLAATTVTNTGPTSLSEGDLGLSPGTAVTGFPPGTISNGVIHAADAESLQAQADLTTAYNDAAGRAADTVGLTELGGQTFTPGVHAGGALEITGTVTLNGGANSVFIFKAASTLVTATSSAVAFTGGASSCNVFWQVGSSATLGTGTTFAGTIMALTSITATTGATVDGRLMARNGAVTLDSNVITRPPSCGPRSLTAAQIAAAQAAAAAAAAQAAADQAAVDAAAAQAAAAQADAAAAQAAAAQADAAAAQAAASQAASAAAQAAADQAAAAAAAAQLAAAQAAVQAAAAQAAAAQAAAAAVTAAQAAASQAAAAQAAASAATAAQAATAQAATAAAAAQAASAAATAAQTAATQAADAQAVASGATAGVLATTGSNVVPLVSAAGVLIAAGAALAFLVRTRGRARARRLKASRTTISALGASSDKGPVPM